MLTNKKGFTLIELLVVVLIIGILASVAIPQYFKVVERSRIAATGVMFSSIASAEEAYLVRQGSYGTDFTKLDQTFSDSAGVPCAAGATCIMKNFTYTIGSSLVGTVPTLTITATRTATGGAGLSARYGAYVLTYKVPGHTTTCTGGANPALCTAELLD